MQGVFSMKKFLKSGFTTGTCVAAATKAALLTYLGNEVNEVKIAALSGEILSIPIENAKKNKCGGFAAVKKNSGDDPDITNGILIQVEVIVRHHDQEIVITAGEGVGIITKPGLSVAVGQPAVNPGPRKMISAVIREVLGDVYGCEVIIHIPQGAELAKKTLNPVLGIEGGLSIIGTSGVVRPMSEEAFKHSLSPQISVAKAKGMNTLVFVPGKIGYDICISKLDISPDAIIQTSNFIGFMLEHAVENKIKNILLVGHLGKLIKIAGGIFHTHNRVADARLEILAAYSALIGANSQMVEEILTTTTTEAAVEIICKNHLEKVYGILAQKISYRSMRYVYQELCVGAVITTLDGTILGMDDNARRIGGDLGWIIK